MVLLYMVTWIPSIYPLYISIYTSTMDPMGIWLVQQNLGTDSTKSWLGWLRHEAKQTKAQPISQKKAIR